MVMAANAEPSTRNLGTIKDTLVRYYNEHKDRFKNEFDFYFYWSVGDEQGDDVTMEKSTEYQNLTYLKVSEIESIFRTFEKSIKAFRYVHDNTDYDWYVRINISMWLNIDLLDNVISTFKHRCMYGNAINSHINANSSFCNDLYMRGDLMIFDKNVMSDIIEHANRYMYSDMNMKNRDGVEHVDDCLVGCCMVDAYGSDYYKRLYMLSYTYMPDYEISDVIKPDMYHIGTRVKTVPPNVGYSGYSWDDNEWRKKDCDKMIKLTEYVENNPFNYSNVKMSDVLVDKSASRPTLFVSLSNQSVYGVFHNFLYNKRMVGR